MPSEIVYHLATAGRMANVNRILQVQMIGDGLQIVGIMVHVMSAAGLSRATMSASIGGDDTITFGEEEQHLLVPIICTQWPAMTEYDRLTFAPVLVIDVDVSSVFFSDCYVWHSSFLYMLLLSDRHRRLF